MRVRTIYVLTGAVWGVITGAAMAMLIFLILGLSLIWFLPESIGTAIAVGAGVAAFVLMFGGSVGAGLSIGRQQERSHPEPAGRRRAILWLFVSCVGMAVAVACVGVVRHMLRQEQIQALAAVSQGQKTLAVKQELLATFHSVGELRSSLRPDTSGFDVSAWFSGQRGGAYRLELRVLESRVTLYQNIETIQLGAGESSTQRFIEYREIIAGYRREIAKDIAVSGSLELVAKIHPLLTPAEQTVLGLADLGAERFPDPVWSKRASATTVFDVHFMICGSNYEIFPPGWTPGRPDWTPGRCTGRERGPSRRPAGRGPLGWRSRAAPWRRRTAPPTCWDG